MKPFNSIQFSSCCRCLLALAVLIVPLMALAQLPVTGNSNSPNQAGVTGTNKSATGNGVGVAGSSVNGEGVHGETTSNTFAGVAGIAQQGTGAGVFGLSNGQGEGVHGETKSNASAAVAGTMTNPGGTGAGVFGRSLGPGPGVFGDGSQGSGPGGFFLGNTKEGVHAETQSLTDAAVAGTNTNTDIHGTGAGVFGRSRGQGTGVHGETVSDTAAGVGGFTTKSNGRGPGVFGQSAGKGPGVFGQNFRQPTAADPDVGAGVFGFSTNGEGVHGETNSKKFSAVVGFELTADSPVAAVLGQHKGIGPGVFGLSEDGEGVHGETKSATLAAVAGISKGKGIGVFGQGSPGPAGFFQGNVVVTEELFVKGTAFQSLLQRIQDLEQRIQRIEQAQGHPGPGTGHAVIVLSMEFTPGSPNRSLVTSGSGFVPGDSVTLTRTIRSPGQNPSTAGFPIQADGQGTFTFKEGVDCSSTAQVTFDVTATGQKSGQSNVASASCS